MHKDDSSLHFSLCHVSWLYIYLHSFFLTVTFLYTSWEKKEHILLPPQIPCWVLEKLVSYAN